MPIIMQSAPPRPRVVAWDSTGAAGTNSATPSWNHTISADADMLLILAAVYRTVQVPVLSAKLGTTDATPITQLYIGKTSGSYYISAAAFYVPNPPAGLQSASFSSSGGTFVGCTANSLSYKNVAGVGAPITAVTGTVSPVTMTAPAPTVIGSMYAVIFTYLGTAASSTFSAFNQDQRYLTAAVTGTEPAVMGDADAIDGGDIVFSAVRNERTYAGGGIIVPLLSTV